ncbi:MAG TPA: DNA primase [bacterium]|nr:DNA primase [bacterium]HPW39518.1 DNA primase [bacterium]
MSRETEEIKAKLDLVDLMSEYIRLTPAGMNYRALCPFHNEKTPSLMISRSKQIWKCFGCGAGGDIFDFLMGIERVEFGEALKLLADKAGVKLSGINQAKQDKGNRHYDICRLAARYWHKVLRESPKGQNARAYLQQRGLSEETIEDFNLGYAVDSWDNLLKFLTGRGFSQAEIFAAGLSVKKNQGIGFYDRFRDRITFPIIDLHGRTVGFGARALKADDLAKYINTPQTVIYNKSAVLYGLYQARAAIKERDLAILVEGYMDVIPSYQIGVKNVVAISGTALTLEQIKLLKRYSNNLAIALDMDAAGRQAAERSIDLALSQEMNVRVLTLAQGKDPGECIKIDPDDWRRAIEQAQPALDYFFDLAFGQWPAAKPEAKKKIGQFLLAKISAIGNPIERDYWLKELAQRLSVSEAILRELIVKPKSAGAGLSRQPVSQPPVALPVNPQLDLLQKLLGLGFIFPRLYSKLAQAGLIDYLTDPASLDLYKKIILFYTKNVDSITKLDVDNSVSQGDLLDLMLAWLGEADDNKLVKEAFLVGQNSFVEIDFDSAQKEFSGLVKKIKNLSLDQLINDLKLQLIAAEKRGEQAESERLYIKLQQLIMEKNN